MDAILTCPSCRTRFRGPSGASAGARCRCSRCRAVFDGPGTSRAYRVATVRDPDAVPVTVGLGAAPVGELEIGARVVPAPSFALPIGMDDPSLAPRLAVTALHGSAGQARPVLTYRVLAPEPQPERPRPIEGPASLREAPLDRSAIRATRAAPIPPVPSAAVEPPAAEPVPPEIPTPARSSARGDLATAVAIGLLAGVATWFFTAGTGLAGWPRWAVAVTAAVACAWGGLRWIAPPR